MEIVIPTGAASNMAGKTKFKQIASCCVSLSEKILEINYDKYNFNIIASSVVYLLLYIVYSIRKCCPMSI